MALTRVHIYEKVDSGFKEPVLKSPNQFLSTAPKLPNDKNHPELSLKSLSLSLPLRDPILVAQGTFQ